jgi:peptidyl-prolyl cis-trans isomerase SurA
MLKKSTVIILLFLIAFSSAVYSQEPIERIVAIVGQEPIMASELAAQIQLTAIQNNIRPATQEELDKMQSEILEQMISERLFLIEAKKDTMITVTSDEVLDAVNGHIAQVASQFETEEQFLEQLSLEGMNLRSFRRRLYPEIESQLLKQKLIGSKLNRISISQKEVMEFYEMFEDSIPDQPEAVRLSHILITFQPSGGTEDSVRVQAEKIRQMAAVGADFASLAIQYSSGPTAVSGGDLGLISPDDVVEEFSRAAFNLQPGGISAAVRTQYGYHIIKCEEKQGGRAHLRHILFEVNPTAVDSALSYKLVDSLLTEIENDGDFKELAKIFSADDDTRKQGGELGWFAVADLPQGFSDAMDSLIEAGDVYGPARTEYGLHIIKKLDWQEGRKLSPETDFDRLKEMARQTKTGEFVENWLEEIRAKTFVEIRL